MNLKSSAIKIPPWNFAPLEEPSPVLSVSPKSMIESLSKLLNNSYAPLTSHTGSIFSAKVFAKSM